MNPASASSILHEGSVIGTKIGTNNIWYRNIVYKSESNIVTLAFAESYLENLIMNGTKMVLKQTSEYFEYIFEGVVSNICTEYPPQISVHVNKAEEIINTRVFPRYDTYLASDIRPAWDSRKHFCIVTNMSLGGVAFASKYVFDYGEECDVVIYLPKGKTVNCKGKVIRKNDKGEFIDYSMQFVDMDETNNNLVSEYIEFQGETVEEMKQHFFDNIKAHIK